MAKYSKSSEYHYLYDKARWKRLRLEHLQKEPLCRTCNAMGRVVEATVCDHIQAHEGDEELFFDADNLQSLCKTCHDSDKQILERSGRRKALIGVDGWPIN